MVKIHIVHGFFLHSHHNEYYLVPSEIYTHRWLKILLGRKSFSSKEELKSLIEELDFRNLTPTAVEQVVACALITQQARVRSPVGTSYLGEVFSGFFLTRKPNVGKLQAPKVPEYHLAFIIIHNQSLRVPMT